MRSKVGDVDGFAWVLKNRLDGFPIEDAAPRFSDKTIRIENQGHNKLLGSGIQNHTSPKKIMRNAVSSFFNVLK